MLGFRIYSVVGKHPKEKSNWLDLNKIKKIPLNKEEMEKMDLIFVNESLGQQIIGQMKLNNPELIYFLQLTEWLLVPEERKRVVIDGLFDIRFKLMTEARWIKNLLKKEFGRDCYLIRNMLELPKKEFEKIQKEKPVVLIEGNNSPHKGLLEGLDVLENLIEECEIWWLTNTKATIPQKFEKLISKKFESIPWEESLKVISNAE
jgi:hypothetical protein